MKDNEELVKKNEGYKNEVDRLRFMNKMLLEGEYSKVSIEDNSDIYWLYIIIILFTSAGD